jgi:urease alpha subunit
MVDLVIRGAQVVSGTAIIRAAVAVKGEQIVAVGDDSLMPLCPQGNLEDGFSRSGLWWRHHRV